MKKKLKYIVLLLLITLCVTVYFYLKPAVKIKQCIIENNIPIKIGPYSSQKITDSIVLYIPYKIIVSNNRLRKIKFDYYQYKNQKIATPKVMYFDKNGFTIGRETNKYNLDEMIEDKKYLNYLKLFFNKEIFPFCDEEYYFYKAFLIKKSSLLQKNKLTNYSEFTNDFFKSQSQNLFRKSNYIVEKKIIDSLYKSDSNNKILLKFVYGDGKYENGYEIEYHINTNKQKVIDYSKMSQAELLEKMSSIPNFEK